MTQDSIIITHADGSTETVALTFRGLNLGSGSKNEVILSGQGVSQQHLRITFDGEGYNVLALPASLPAFLNDTQLLPSVERKWQPGQVLRLGEHRISLQRAAPGNQPPAATDTVQPPISPEPEPQPLRIFMVGIGILIVVVIVYIIAFA
jgi:predicted component of type VI protein secretion system